MDDTQRMMQMGGFGMDPTKVCFFCLLCSLIYEKFDGFLHTAENNLKLVED